MNEISAAEIARVTGGTVLGSADSRVSEVAPLEKASRGALSFVASAKYVSYLPGTRAGVVLVRPEWAPKRPEGCTAVVVEDPHSALAAVIPLLYTAAEPSPGVHETALVGPDCSIGNGVSIGPYAVVGAGCVIGRATVIGAHAVVGAGCRFGEGVTIDSHATVYDGVLIGDRSIVHSGARVGKAGFGYVWRDGHHKIPQIGGCRIESDVEIGTNVTIDRGSVGDTVIGQGTKIDNLVHIGHNVQIGKHVLIIAQVGISGSTKIGDGSVLAGQAGVGGHLEIGAGARIGGQAGVTGDVPGGATYSGYPARPHRESLRAQAAFFKLPAVIDRLKRIEAAVFRREPE